MKDRPRHVGLSRWVQLLLCFSREVVEILLIGLAGAWDIPPVGPLRRIDRAFPARCCILSLSR